MQSTGENLFSLTGDVEVQRGSEKIRADRIDYQRDTGDVSARGNASYMTPNFELHGDALDANLTQSTAKTGEASYRIRVDQDKRQAGVPEYGNGAAQQIIRTKDGVVILKDAHYSSCPPSENGWRIKASSVELDPNNAEGTATHTTLWFKGVPLFYTPWFSFPLGDARKSGFLTPRIGRNSLRGTELSVPWYWNIAPQADATLTPTYMTDRGVQLASEWRYLSRSGYWQLDNEFIDNDKQTQTERHFSRLQHTGQPFSGWTTSIDASNVSDATYFDDYGDTFDITSITHLERRADLSYGGYNELVSQSFRIRLQDYQTVDNTIAAASRPYRRLPQITHSIAPNARPGGLQFDLGTELVHFDRNNSITSERLDLRPRVQLPFESISGFFRPSLSVWHTRYRVDNSAVGGIDNEQIERTLPVFSLDTGLYFDRPIASGTQTLEPRLFYLRVPYEDQSAIPVFDSSAFGFSFAQLFRENRFTGADRVGDARQLSLAITTRFLEESGREWASASIGQVHFFDDRRVTLPGVAVEDRGRSNMVVDLRTEMGSNWRTGTLFQWDPTTDDVERSTTELSYTPSTGNRISMAHRYLINDYEQVDLSFSKSISSHWSVAGQWNYELDDDQNIDSTLALKYDSCCWAFRAAARRYLINDGQETANSFYFELEMKGLGRLGDDTGGLL